MSLLTAREVASLLRVTPQWVYLMARQDILPGVKIGNKVRFDERKIMDWIDNGGSETQVKKGTT